MTGKRDLTSGSLMGNLFRLAAPVAAAAMLSALYNLVDAFWLGRWSKEALAAPGVCGPFFFFTVAFGMGLAQAGTAMVAQHTGARQHRQADRAAAQVMLMMCAVSAVLAVPMVAFAPSLLRLAKVPPEVAPNAALYLRIVMVGLPINALTFAYGGVLRALGDTVTVLLIGVFTNALNFILDPIMIFGWLGVPAMGVGGAALATLVSQLAGTLICYVLVRRQHAGLHIEPGDLRPDWPLIRKALAIGLPVAVSNSADSIGFGVFQAMVNSMGTTVIGAFTVGFRVIHFFNVPTQATAMAAAPVVGQALGAGKPRLARRAVLMAAGLVAGVMFVPLGLLIWQGQAIARAFINDPAVVAEARRFFYIVPASTYFFGVLATLMAAFYGSGHTRPAMVVSVIRVWFVRLPVGYLLGFVLGLGSMGVYAGMVAGNIVGALLAFWFFMLGGWQRAVVPTPGGEPEASGTTPGSTQ